MMDSTFTLADCSSSSSSPAEAGPCNLLSAYRANPAQTTTMVMKMCFRFISELVKDYFAPRRASRVIALMDFASRLPMRPTPVGPSPGHPIDFAHRCNRRFPHRPARVNPLRPLLLAREWNPVAGANPATSRARWPIPSMRRRNPPARYQFQKPPPIGRSENVQRRQYVSLLPPRWGP